MKNILIGLLISCSVNLYVFAAEGHREHNHERVVKTRKQNFRSKFLADIYNAQALFSDTVDASFFEFDVKDDTRQEVRNVEVEPYTNVGLLVGRDPVRNQGVMGTAFKVSDRHLLTAAHNVVECKGGKRFFSDFTYYSSYNKGEAADISGVKSFFVPRDFCHGGADFAILELEKKIYPDSFLPFVALQKKELLDKPVRVIGYPGDLQLKSQSQHPIMFEDTGVISGVREHILLHNANTNEGNSGGPVILDKEIEIAQTSEDYLPNPVIAIHVAGPDPKIDNTKNRATMIDGSVFDIIHKVLKGEKPESMDEVRLTKKGGSNEKY